MLLARTEKENESDCQVKSEEYILRIKHNDFVENLRMNRKTYNYKDLYIKRILNYWDSLRTRMRRMVNLLF